MPDDKLATILRSIAESTESVRIKSQALKAPVAMLITMSTLAVAAVVYKVPFWFQTIATGLAVSSLVNAIVAYWYFAIKDPDRLGSEAFVSRQNHLKILASNGLDAIPAIDVEDPNPRPIKKAALPKAPRHHLPKSAPLDEEAP